jgi:predicted DNA-binding transcriptional regulator AlpA
MRRVTSASRYLTSQEVAERLQRSRPTILRLARLPADHPDRLPAAVKIDGKTGAYLFDPAVIELYARRHPRRERRVA